MFLGLSVIIWILALLVLLIVFAFVFYKQVMHVSYLVIVLAFITSVIAAFTALFVPTVYHTGAEIAFANTQFAGELKSLDQALTSVSSAPETIINKIQDLFNPNRPQPTTTNDSNLYNQFIDLMGEIFRWVTFVIAILIMFTAVYFRYTYASIIESEKLRKAYQLLQETKSTLG